MTRKVASKTLALINCAFDKTPDCSNMVKKRAYSSSVNRTMRQFFAGSVLGGLPPFPRFWGDFFCSMTLNLARRVSKTLRRLKIWSRHTGCPVKSDDFGGASPPLAGKLFCVTENISRNGKHSLLSPEQVLFRGLKNGSNITPRFPLFVGQHKEAIFGSRQSLTGQGLIAYHGRTRRQPLPHRRQPLPYPKEPE